MRLAAFILSVLAGLTLAMFDGLPSSPQPFSQHPEYVGWDVQVHSRDAQTWTDLESMQAGHGPDCSAPPATHENHSYAGAVYICNNHLMTAINAGGYGVLYITPNKLLDWSNGPATLSFDMSTFQSSPRDWVDLWLQSFDGNVALPLEDFLPDLQAGNIPRGQALRGREYLHIDGNTGTKRFKTTSHLGPLTDTGQNWQANSMTQRDTFVLTIDATKFSFCKPGEGICWAKDQPHGLTITQATVQIGHHSYNPTKACIDTGRPAAECPPGVWHWDNVDLSPSVPFAIIHTDTRATVGGTVKFSAPAPLGSYLRFSAVGKVTVNGLPVSPAFPASHVEAHNSYFVPIQQGTTSVNIGLSADDWYHCGFGCQAKDFAIWSRGLVPTVTTPTATLVPPTATSVPPTATAVATSTPVPTATPVSVLCYRSLDGGVTITLRPGVTSC